MADRHWFGQGAADWTFFVGAGNTAVLNSDTLTMWNTSAGGVQYTDLLDVNGTAITEVTSGDGSTLQLGTIPQFQGPDGVVELWADGGTNTRYKLVANDLGATVADLGQRLADAENILANLSAANSNVVLAVTYDEGAGTWPTRPEIAGTRRVYWHGPNSSPPPAGHMATNDQFFGWL